MFLHSSYKVVLSFAFTLKVFVSKERRILIVKVGVPLHRLYDFTAQHYDELYGGEQLRKYRAIERFLPSSFIFKVILDAGCGTGIVMHRLAQRGGMIIGVDFSKGMIGRAKKRLRAFRHVDLVLGDIERLPFRIHAFDAIISLTVLQNCRDPEVALKSLLNALCDDGIAIVTYVKRSKVARVVEALFKEHIIRDLDPIDDILILDKKLIKDTECAGNDKVED